MDNPASDATNDRPQSNGDPATIAGADEGSGRSRYSLVERGGDTWISCVSARGIQLRVQQGLTVTEAARKRFPKQTIFLDGVYGGGPLYDNETRHYSLDHHGGCIRAFTLATCEQAAVILLQGLPLEEGSWQLWINDPDLDALLAAWLLLNHTELRRDHAQLLRHVMPLVRVEGVIDGHGLDKEPLAALTDDEYRRQKLRIEQLMTREQQLKSSAQWTSTNFLDYSKTMLTDLDNELYPEGYVDQLLSVEESARVRIDRRRSIALLCSAHQGIYAVETTLKQRHGKELGLIVLDNGDRRFTLRQVDSFLPHSLADLYPLLNQRDPMATDDSSGENQWGGAHDIGGSPRKTGSGLDGAQILEVVREVYRGTGWLKRLVTKIRS